MNKHFLLVCGLLAWLVSPFAGASTASEADIKKRFWGKNKQYRANWAKQLGWVEDPDTPTICRGYYLPKESTLDKPFPDLPAEPITYITADSGALRPTGRSDLIGNVMVHQPGRSVTADRAQVYRDANGDIIKINLYGEVTTEEDGKMIITPQAQLDLTRNTSTTGPALYRFRLDRFPADADFSRIAHELYGWGHADQIIQIDKEHFELINATYTTCPPTRMPWQIRARQLYIDQEKDEGIAKHATFNIGNVPILYAPVYKFPLAGQRKTGFLLPLVGYSQDLGAIVGFPFYLNIAPNVDATITPTYYSERVFALNNNFRYLFAMGQGTVNFDLLPYDREFAKFKQQNQTVDPGILKDSNTRYGLRYTHFSQFNPNWSAALDLNKVSDDFYLQDLSTNLVTATENQLLRQGRLDYKNDHWDLFALLQSYQTLSPFNQPLTNPVYRRLPQVGAKAIYPELLPRVNFNFIGEFNYFEWPLPSRPEPAGSRFNLYPELTMPLSSGNGFLTPRVLLHQSNYHVQQPMPNVQQNINRTAPVFSVDSGLYFNQQQRWFGRSYQHTLTPRVFYLWVPTVNQDQIPNFDSTYNIFNFDQLFRYNRFSGNDRIMNANQVSAALSSSWYDEELGYERLGVGIGQIYYFAKRKISLCNEVNTINCNTTLSNPNETIVGFTSNQSSASPLVGFANVNFTSKFGLVSDVAWDPSTSSMDNANISLVLRPNSEKLVSVGYSYLVNGDITLAATGKPDKNLHYLNTSMAWPLSERWSGIGIFQYSLSKKTSMEYYLGLEYNACCWGVRVLGGRLFRNLDNNFKPNFRDAFFVQFVFRGLSNISSSNQVRSLVAENLPGYLDRF